MFHGVIQMITLAPFLSHGVDRAEAAGEKEKKQKQTHKQGGKNNKK